MKEINQRNERRSLLGNVEDTTNEMKEWKTEREFNVNEKHKTCVKKQCCRN